MSKSIAEQLEEQKQQIAEQKGFLEKMWSGFQEWVGKKETKAEGDNKGATATAGAPPVKEQAAAEGKTIDFMAVLAEVKVKITALEGVVAQQKTDLEAKNKKITELEAQQKSVGEKAIELVAGQGVELQELPKGNTDGSKAEDPRAKVIARFNELSAKDPMEAAKFYSANEKILFGGEAK